MRIIMAMRTVLLPAGYLLFLFYTSFSYGVASISGEGYFDDTFFSEFEWHVDQEGYAVFDKAIFNGIFLSTAAPCKAAWDKAVKLGMAGRFSGCSLKRTICAASCDYTTVFDSSSINTPSRAQLIRYLETTGRLGFVGYSDTGYVFYTLSIVSSSGSQSSRVPRPGSGGGGGIPITPVEPPTSCSASSTTLDHKTLSIADLQGNTETGTLTISCNKKASVRLKVFGYNHASGLALTNDRSLISRLTLDDIAADKALNVSVPDWGGASVDVKSVLEKTGTTVTPGTYSKALIVLITVD